MPIIAILGGLSGGKTTLATYLGALAVSIAKGEIIDKDLPIGFKIRELSRIGNKEKKTYSKDDIIVTANYLIKIDNFKFFSVDELIKLIKAIESGEEPELTNTILILDEIWAYLESRMGKSKVERLITYFIMQSAKVDVQIIYTAQLDGMADTRLRNQPNIVKIIANNDFEEYFHYTWLTDKGVIHKRLSHKNAEKYIFPLYDTTYRIPLATEQVKKALQEEKDTEKRLKRKRE